VTVACAKVLFQDLSGGTEEEHTGLRAVIRVRCGFTDMDIVFCSRQTGTVYHALAWL
jgi:hypothetical protein